MYASTSSSLSYWRPSSLDSRGNSRGASFHVVNNVRGHKSAPRDIAALELVTRERVCLRYYGPGHIGSFLLLFVFPNKPLSSNEVLVWETKKPRHAF